PSPSPFPYTTLFRSPARLRDFAIFNSSAVHKLVEKFRYGRAIGTKDNMALAGILSTQLLVDQFVEQPQQQRTNHGCELRQDTAVDRKSTRLNSSHQI